MATLKDVAALAGVSRSTAGLVLSGRGDELRIGSACAERVRAAARELRYRGNYLARSLSIGRAMTIGLAQNVSPLRHMVFWWTAAQGAGARLREKGYDFLFVGQGRSESLLDHGASALQERRIDGLNVAMPPTRRLPTLPEPVWPLVLMGRPPQDGYLGVHLDAAPGIREAVRHLAALWHRDILYLGTRVGEEVRLPERYASFREAAAQAGLRHEARWLHGVFAEEIPLEEQIAGYRADIEQTGVPAGITAVVCYNDLVAVAMVSWLRARGIEVPREVSVVGFDDLWAGLALPPLTTISHELPAIGMRAADLMVGMLEAGTAYPNGVEVLVPSRLVVRGSTGPAPRRGT
jgi:LacI family transcriptional regulator